MEDRSIDQAFPEPRYWDNNLLQNYKKNHIGKKISYLIWSNDEEIIKDQIYFAKEQHADIIFSEILIDEINVVLEKSVFEFLFLKIVYLPPLLNVNNLRSKNAKEKYNILLIHNNEDTSKINGLFQKVLVESDGTETHTTNYQEKPEEIVDKILNSAKIISTCNDGHYNRMICILCKLHSKDFIIVNRSSRENIAYLLLGMKLNEKSKIFERNISLRKKFNRIFSDIPKFENDNEIYEIGRIFYKISQDSIDLYLKSKGHIISANNPLNRSILVDDITFENYYKIQDYYIVFPVNHIISNIFYSSLLNSEDTSNGHGKFKLEFNNLISSFELFTYYFLLSRPNFKWKRVFKKLISESVFFRTKIIEFAVRCNNETDFPKSIFRSIEETFIDIMIESSNKQLLSDCTTALGKITGFRSKLEANYKDKTENKVILCKEIFEEKVDYSVSMFSSISKFEMFSILRILVSSRCEASSVINFLKSYSGDNVNLYSQCIEYFFIQICDKFAGDPLSIVLKGNKIEKSPFKLVFKEILELNENNMLRDETLFYAELLNEATDLAKSPLKQKTHNHFSVLKSFYLWFTGRRSTIEITKETTDLAKKNPQISLFYYIFTLYNKDFDKAILFCKILDKYHTEYLNFDKPNDWCGHWFFAYFGLCLLRSNNSKRSDFYAFSSNHDPNFKELDTLDILEKIENVENVGSHLIPNIFR